MTWEGTPTYIITSVHDPLGLAGLEVVLSGDVEQRYVAEHMPTLTIEVPLRGQVRFDIALHQDGQMIADGSSSWSLAANTAWELEFRRGPIPASVVSADGRANRKSRCAGPECSSVWRFAIAEEARNYPDEALFVTLWRSEIQ